MPGEVAEIALMTDSLGLGDASAANAASSLAPVIERAKTGDMAAFEQLIEHYQRRVITTAWRMLGNPEDARDAAQEVFLRLYKYLRGYRSDQDFAGWLYRIIVNVCRDQAKARKRDARFFSYEAGHELGNLGDLASTENVESDAMRAQECVMITRALNTLSRKERAAIVLRDLEGLSTGEVARVLGSSQTTVRSQISAARAKIRQYRERMLNQRRRG